MTFGCGSRPALDRSFDSSGAASGFAEAGIQSGGGGADIPTAPEWALILLGAILLWQMAIQGQSWSCTP